MPNDRSLYQQWQEGHAGVWLLCIGGPCDGALYPESGAAFLVNADHSGAYDRVEVRGGVYYRWRSVFVGG